MDEPKLYDNPRILMGSGAILIIITLAWFLVDLGIIFPPRFEGEKIITIEPGMDARRVVDLFSKAGIIRQPSDFLLFLKITRRERAIKPGSYTFAEPISVLGITRLITGSAAEREIRILEGWTNYEIAEYLEREARISSAEFLKTTQGKEGYLFPDTYRIFQNASALDVANLLQKTFYEKVALFVDDIKRQKRTLKDLIIMASLIEKESSGDEDRAIISGILWKRLGANIPLQVDATLSYLMGKESKELTTEDLRIDSPYNTYRYPGLPQGPIGNPGLKSIKAALYPKTTPYLFYLHDHDGNPHYARTFEEHIENKNRYLR